jgi:acetyl esterase
MSNEAANPAMPSSRIMNDPRLDPRVKRFFANMPQAPKKPNVTTREELLTQENTPAALAAYQWQFKMFNSMDSEEVAPSVGL